MIQTLYVRTFEDGKFGSKKYEFPAEMESNDLIEHLGFMRKDHMWFESSDTAFGKFGQTENALDITIYTKYKNQDNDNYAIYKLYREYLVELKADGYWELILIFNFEDFLELIKKIEPLISITYQADLGSRVEALLDK